VQTAATASPALEAAEVEAAESSREDGGGRGGEKNVSAPKIASRSLVSLSFRLERPPNPLQSAGGALPVVAASMLVVGGFGVVLNTISELWA
jgi:hypothetical protein